MTRGALGAWSAFDGMAARCLRYWISVDGRIALAASCLLSDRDGDAVLTTAVGEAVALVGGTGTSGGSPGAGSPSRKGCATPRAASERW